jgi:NADP-reducing hydrogenase subunit HndD
MSQQFITINGQKLEFNPGESVLDVAKRNNIDIPHFCHHEDLPVGSSCRTCLVQIVQQNKSPEHQKMCTSCSLEAKDGLEVTSKSEEIKEVRKTNLELLLAGHTKNCQKCKQGVPCPTAQTITRYSVDENKYQKYVPDAPPVKLNCAVEISHENCIACESCIKICNQLGTGYLTMEGEGINRHIAGSKSPKNDCIYCGQCSAHCPTGAAHEISHIERVEQDLNNPDKIVIAQMAPSVRVSIGEEFGVNYGTNLAQHMNTAFRQLGFNKVFDVNMGADITTFVEAGELVDRIKNNKPLPMFTSCCPAWVKFLEFYYPELIPNLTTARSPQIHSAGAYKTWWAEKEGIDPKKISIVSIMPCTSKKYEAAHEKLKIDGMLPVDHVVTSREMATMLKKNNIDLPNLEPSEVDTAGQYSGAAAIYGASGGVMESALRTAAFMITGEDMGRLEYEEVRGMEGIKKATITIGELNINVGVVSTAKNARIVLKEIKDNPESYQYVEFMACPGGCIGGGGQPIPNSSRITKERTKGLYSLDKSLPIRKAHQNPIIQEFWQYIEKQPEERQTQILHTHYEPKQKGE